MNVGMDTSYEKIFFKKLSDFLVLILSYIFEIWWGGVSG